MRYHIEHDNDGYFIADKHHVEAVNASFTTYAAAKTALKTWQASEAQAHYDPHIIDSYNRDDLGVNTHPLKKGNKTINYLLVLAYAIASATLVISLSYLGNM